MYRVTIYCKHRGKLRPFLIHQDTYLVEPAQDPAGAHVDSHVGLLVSYWIVHEFGPLSRGTYICDPVIAVTVP